MSFQAMTWAIAQKTGGPAAKVVLLSLANYANADAECWPKIATIAAETEMSARSVHAHLTALRDRSLIDWRHQTRPDGSQTVNIYRLIMDPAARANGSGNGQDGTNAQIVGPADSADPPCRSRIPPPADSADQVEPVIGTSHGTGGETYVGESPRAHAREEDPPTPQPPPKPEPATPAAGDGGIPPRRCPEHIRTLGPVPACGACKEARLTAEQWERAHPVSAANTRTANAAPKHPECPDCRQPAPAGHCNRCAANWQPATPGTVHALRDAIPRRRKTDPQRRACPHGRPERWLDAAKTVEACPDCRRGDPDREMGAEGRPEGRAATG